MICYDARRCGQRPCVLSDLEDAARAIRTQQVGSGPGSQGIVSWTNIFLTCGSCLPARHGLSASGLICGATLRPLRMRLVRYDQVRCGPELLFFSLFLQSLRNICIESSLPPAGTSVLPTIRSWNSDVSVVDVFESRCVLPSSRDRLCIRERYTIAIPDARSLVNPSCAIVQSRVRRTPLNLPISGFSRISRRDRWGDEAA